MLRTAVALCSRLGAALALALVVSAATFAAVEVLPGDPATTILGANATPERVEALREQLGLERPVVARYGDWLIGLVRGDLGDAATTSRGVWEIIATPLRNTAIFAAAAFLAMSVVSTVGGLIAGSRPGRVVDRWLSTGSLGVVAVPDFVVAGLLIAVFAFHLEWLSSVSLVPIGGSPLDDPAVLILPVATTTLVGGTYGMRQVRAVVAEASTRPYIEAARLAGIGEAAVLRRHLLPTVAAPTAQVLALAVPYLIGGTVVVERVFAYPGLGSLFVDQIGARDVTVVSVAAMIMAGAVILAFFVADAVGVVMARHVADGARVAGRGSRR